MAIYLSELINCVSTVLILKKNIQTHATNPAKLTSSS